MAFNDENKGYKCGRDGCCNVRKHYRMIESYRDRDAYTETGFDGEQVIRHLRICEECELQTRLEEFPSRPEKWKEKYPTYCDPTTVYKTIRFRAKGDKWCMFGKSAKRPRRS